MAVSLVEPRLICSPASEVRTTIVCVPFVAVRFPTRSSSSVVTVIPPPVVSTFAPLATVSVTSSPASVIAIAPVASRSFATDVLAIVMLFCAAVPADPALSVIVLPSMPVRPSTVVTINPSRSSNRTVSPDVSIAR